MSEHDLPPRRAQAPPPSLSKDEMGRWAAKRLSDQQSSIKFRKASRMVEFDTPREERQIRLVMNAFVADDEPVDLDELAKEMGVK